MIHYFVSVAKILFLHSLDPKEKSAISEEAEHWPLNTAREAGQDRGQGRQPRPLCHVPIGRGGGAEELVPENPEPD